MEQYKYQAEINALIQQGLKMPLVVKPNNLKGFRFTFKNDIGKSYLPNYIMKPQRAIIANQRKVTLEDMPYHALQTKEKLSNFIIF